MRITKSSVANHCSNWNDGQCIGVVYKIEYVLGSSIHNIKQIVAEDVAEKQCLLTQNKECSFWSTYVVPSLTED